MGTEFSLHLYCADATRAAEIAQEVFDEVDRIEQLLSNYRASSELSRINANAAIAPVTTDPEMLDFLSQARQWSEVSDGAFDMTVGPLMKSWGFYRHAGRVPPAAELERMRGVTGWQKVQVDARERTVRFTARGVELDPGGIGKGFAVDAAVRVLRAEGVSAALISAGGSTIYALGAPPQRAGWKIVIPGPLPSRATLSVVTLRDTSLSSADCSQKSFVVEGHRFCHIMDPRTMRPVEGRIQVTIIDPSATASDALSNVIFVLPPDRSLPILSRYAPDARALILSGDWRHAHCARFRWSGTLAAPNCASN